MTRGPAALLDECLDLAIVGALRQRDFDVVSLLIVGPRGIADGLVLERSAELGRVLITQNVNDFKAVHTAFIRQGRPHPGIIGLPQRGTLHRRVLRAAMLLDWIGTQTHASRFFVWGEFQHLLAGGYRPGGYTDEEVQQVLGNA